MEINFLLYFLRIKNIVIANLILNHCGLMESC